MNISAYVPLIVALPKIIRNASLPEEAWTEITRRISAIDPQVPVVVADTGAEVSTVVAQLRATLTETPPPPGLSLLYFGLFAAADDATIDARVGYYVAGSTRELPPIDASSQLVGDLLDYWPAKRDIESPLLQRIKAAALANAEQYDQYDYVWMLAAAAVVSVFAIRQLGMETRIVVGFDSGDALEFRAGMAAPHA